MRARGPSGKEIVLGSHRASVKSAAEELLMGSAPVLSFDPGLN